MNADQFFAELWTEYTKVTPQAARIHDLFERDTRPIINDHVAFRTFNIPPIDIRSLEPFILDLGYTVLDEYHFPKKRLNARSYYSPGQPKIFLSEYLVSSLNEDFQYYVNAACSLVTPDQVQDISILNKGRLWPMPTWQTYQGLLAQSDYAAWLMVMGLRANHFTISVNHLHQHPTLASVNRWLKDYGFTLNSSGGEIKGTVTDCLEQSSTLADQQMVTFADGDRHLIQTCYYEFAKRYEDSPGHLFQGFVPASADKIFESTHAGAHRA